MRALLISLVALSPALASAHSFYPLECCSDRDCYTVPVDQVKTVPGGWLVEGGTFIAYGEARPSPDGRFHICRREDGKGALITIPGKPACFWVPMVSS